MEKTEAIVLSASPYSETSLIVHLLTREMGAVRALAKGARRRGRATQAAFEPFSRVQAAISVRSPDKLGVLGEVSLVREWDYLRCDVKRLAFAGLGVEVLGAVARDSPPEPYHFEEACRFLDTLGETEAPGSLLIGLLLRLLRHAGFPPHLAEPWTAETLPPVVVYHFDRAQFDRPGPADASSTMRLPASALAPVLDMIEASPTDDASLDVPTSAGRPILRWLIRVWEDHLHCRLKAAKFLEKMVIREKSS